jgi:NAD(P)-dependent dehydrogenase (short-subunit alcohol dehydrogenase family)
MSTDWNPAKIPSLDGRRVIVTGANSGIGYHTAAVLARHGAEVVLACRDVRRGEEALARLRRDQPDAKLSVERLDLASLASVRDFADRQLDQTRPLDLLINNAGVMAPPHRLETVDGFECQFGTNVLGHFTLTARLMPLLEAAAQRSKDAPRVVTVASIAHKTGHINFDDLQSTRHYGPMRAYRQSKLGNLIFARELDRRLREAGSRVISVAAHPGVAKTNLFRDDRTVMTRAVRSLLGEMIGALLNSDVDGALPTLYAATAPNVEHGGYYGPLGLFEARGKRVGPARIAPQALDAEVAKRLWQVCETLTGKSFG